MSIVAKQETKTLSEKSTRKKGQVMFKKNRSVCSKPLRNWMKIGKSEVDYLRKQAVEPLKKSSRHSLCSH